MIAGIIGLETELDTGPATSPAGSPISRARASERRASPAASAVRPISRNTIARPARAAVSARDGGRSATASRTAVKWPSAAARSAEDCAAQPSQSCATHHPPLPASARPAAWQSSRYSPASRPRRNHHQPSALASRNATRADRAPSPRPAPAAWWRPRHRASGPRPAHRCWSATRPRPARPPAARTRPARRRRRPASPASASSPAP